MHVVIFLIAWHIEIRVLNVKTKQTGQFCNTQHVPNDFTQKSSKNEYLWTYVPEVKITLAIDKFQSQRNEKTGENIRINTSVIWIYNGVLREGFVVGQVIWAIERKDFDDVSRIGNQFEAGNIFQNVCTIPQIKVTSL